MTGAMRELEVLIARASIPEIARAVSLEGRYQQAGARVSRATFFETEVLGWWPRRREPSRTIAPSAAALGFLEDYLDTKELAHDH